jgi:Fe-S cluster assembly protein SufD
VSSVTETPAGVAFAPTDDGLEAAIALLEQVGERSGGIVAVDERRAALARYATLPIPGGRPSRGWRHDYAALRFEELRYTSDRVAVPASNDGLVHRGATALTAPGSAASDPRVVVLPLADAVRDARYRAAIPALDEGIVEDKFAALATAFQNCGAFVWVPAGVVLETPIQLVFAQAAPYADAVFPRIVVVLGAGARATVLERQLGAGPGLVCGVVTAQLGAEAALDYVAIQQSGEESRVLMRRTAHCAADATIRWHLAELGATLARSVLDAHLDEKGANAEVDALFFNTGFQHVDLTTTTDHAVGNTRSSTVVRTAAADRGQGRFFGNITIRPHAHGSDASLRDDALLLSRRAHIDSVPALAIAANDVSAFHGATVGSLDRDALFYAASRGIARTEAVRMVALAFFEPAIARLPSEALREEIRAALDDKIEAATEIDA